MAAESSSRSRSSSSPERTERHCKVRFEGSTQQSESPRSKWRRLGRLTLLRQGRNHKAQPVPQSPVPVGLTTSEEEESSSNSTPTPNLANGRLQAGRGTEVEMAACTRSMSQTTGGTSYLAMHSSSASTAVTTEDKRNKKRRERGTRNSCLFGALHVETGTRIFLLFYMLLSGCGVVFGSISTMVWILVPLVVAPLAGYALSRHASKYLYPLLVISVVHSLVALVMVLIVGCFSLLCFDQLKTHFAQSLAVFPSGPFPASSFTALCCALTMALSLGLSLFFFWQSLVIYSCIAHFDVLVQQKRQQQQQIQQQMAKESKHQSIPMEHRHTGTQPVSRQVECSQCISEIRQSGQILTEQKQQYRQ